MHIFNAIFHRNPQKSWGGGVEKPLKFGAFLVALFLFFLPGLSYSAIECPDGGRNDWDDYHGNWIHYCYKKTSLNNTCQNGVRRATFCYYSRDTNGYDDCFEDNDGCCAGYYNYRYDNGVYRCDKCPDGYACAGGYAEPALCTGATYADYDGQCHDCWDGYDYNKSDGKKSVLECQIKCPAGTRVARPYEGCVSDYIDYRQEYMFGYGYWYESNWITPKDEVVNLGSVSSVIHCPIGYLFGYDNTPDAHDDISDCKIDVPAGSYATFAYRGMTVQRIFLVNENYAELSEIRGISPDDVRNGNFDDAPNMFLDKIVDIPFVADGQNINGEHYPVNYEPLILTEPMQVGAIQFAFSLELGVAGNTMMYVSPTIDGDDWILVYAGQLEGESYNLDYYYAPPFTTVLLGSDSHPLEMGEYFGHLECPAGYYCPGADGVGIFDTAPKIPCPNGWTSPAGASDVGSCGRILNFQPNGAATPTQIYLRSEKKTAPALAVQIDEHVLYGNMTPVNNTVRGNMYIKYDNQTYHVTSD